MSHPLQVTVNGLTIDYAAMPSTERLCQTQLGVAHSQGLLEFHQDTKNGYMLVSVNGTLRCLTVSEVPGYVLGVYDSAGVDPTPVAYRIGIVESQIPKDES